MHRSNLLRILDAGRRDRVVLFTAAHEHMHDVPPSEIVGHVRVCKFNLGYRPGSSKRGDPAELITIEKTSAPKTNRPQAGIKKEARPRSRSIVDVDFRQR